MHRDDDDKQRLLARLARIQGQLTGVGRMINEDRYCPEILNTVSAVHAALRGLEASLLEQHVRHCVREAASNPGALDDKLTELIALYRRKHA